MCGSTEHLQAKCPRRATASTHNAVSAYEFLAERSTNENNLQNAVNEPLSTVSLGIAGGMQETRELLQNEYATSIIHDVTSGVGQSDAGANNMDDTGVQIVTSYVEDPIFTNDPWAAHMNNRAPRILAPPGQGQTEGSQRQGMEDTRMISGAGESGAGACGPRSGTAFNAVPSVPSIPVSAILNYDGGYLWKH